MTENTNIETVETKERLNFVEEVIEEAIAKGETRVQTRFPPEPNGYLHIGHCKALTIDFGTAEKYGGLCNLRFDDTNPAKEDPEFVKSIYEDLCWLGAFPDGGVFFDGHGIRILFDEMTTRISERNTYELTFRRGNPIGLDFEDRAELYRRIDLRVDIMLRQGLLEEIRELLASGIPASATSMQAIGYKEFIDAMAGRSTMEEAIAQVQQSSRRYAKRQLTWFRRNKNIHWLVRTPETSSEEILEKARQLIIETDK